MAWLRHVAWLWHVLAAPESPPVQRAAQEREHAVSDVGNGGRPRRLQSAPLQSAPLRPAPLPLRKSRVLRPRYLPPRRRPAPLPPLLLPLPLPPAPLPPAPLLPLALSTRLSSDHQPPLPSAAL